MGILKVIEWISDNKNTIVHKMDFNKNTINKGSMLTVRDGQVAIFADKGKMADVFLPGSYKLDTSSIPILTRLLSWKYGFEKPFKSDVYFVRTTQFIDQKWGTTSPVILKDKDYGAIRIRGYGSYSFRVEDAYVFMQELSGTSGSYHTTDIVNYIKSLIITDMTKALGKAQVPILELASNLGELANLVKENMSEDFKKMGIALVNFNVENFSLPEDLEKMLDKTTSMNMIRGSMDVYSQMAAADALRDAAKNPGVAGSTIGAGLGVGMGVGIGQVFSSAFANNSQQVANGSNSQDGSLLINCSKCGSSVSSDSKFCKECGTLLNKVCNKCGALVHEGDKFCKECGNSLLTSCPNCGADIIEGAKFCKECGQKLDSNPLDNNTNV